MHEAHVFTMHLNSKLIYSAKKVGLIESLSAALVFMLQGDVSIAMYRSSS